MKYSTRLRLGPALLLTGIVAASCVERTTPTNPAFEQAVFNALGGLAPGETMSLVGAAAAEALVAGGAVPGEFVYIPFHASTSRGANLLIQVEGENLSEPPLASFGPTGEVPGSLAYPGPDWAMHERIHARMKREAAPYLHRARRSLELRPGELPDLRTDLSGDRAHVGQVVQLNANASGPACTAFNMRSGRVEAIGQRSIIVGDVNNPPGGFTRTDYESFATDIDQLVFPTVTQYFSEPTDIDRNGRIIVFFTRAVNEITRPTDQGFVGGFFWVRDVFPREECRASNEAEIFFILVPDPQALASHIAHTRENVYRSAVNTVGHELQHLINASRRVWVNEASVLEEVWLDEGLSHSAEELLFYAASGLEPGSNLGAEAMTNPAIRAALDRFMRQNLARYDLYILNVTRHSPIGVSDGLELRGAAWAFLRYAADHSGQPNEEFFRGLVNRGEVGLSNLNAALGDDALDWIQRWGVSIYADDLIAGPDVLLQQPSWNFRSLLPAALGRGFRLDVRTLAQGEGQQLELLAGTSGYLRFGGSSMTLSRIRTSSGGAAPPPQLRVTIVRVR
jgi:hypothetical protein